MFQNGRMKRTILAAIAMVVPALSSDAVTIQRTGDRIEVAIGGSPFTAFYFGGGTTKPYLHPLRAADGTIVTRGYPMEEIEGEQRDHPHHRGAWFSHGNVNGVDFWANEVEQRGRGMPKGTILLETVSSSGSGTPFGVIEATLTWNGPEGEPLVREQRRMHFSRKGDRNVVDFDIQLTALQESVKFADTKEGTFAVRLATELEEQHLRATGIRRTGRIWNAEGLQTEARAWGKRSTWVDYSGSISGKPLGVAILDHPANPKHPTYWHVRGYGLFAANAFGEHDFHADPKRDGSMTISRGESLRFRYRVLIHPGRTADAEIDTEFDAWAGPGGN